MPTFTTEAQDINDSIDFKELGVDESVEFVPPTAESINVTTSYVLTHSSGGELFRRVVSVSPLELRTYAGLGLTPHEAYCQKCDSRKIEIVHDTMYFRHGPNWRDYTYE